MVNDSILKTVKQACSVYPTDTSFDDILIMYTNTVLVVLRQMGIGPEDGLFITGDTETWSDLIDDDEMLIKLQEVKTYVGLRVRKLFDPPTNGSVKDAIEETIKEMEWRLFINIEPKEGNVL